MIRSMTGFGASEGAVGGARVSVELRTVNHRFFSPPLKLPSARARWEPEVREALRRRIARGHVTVTARIERPAESGAVLDEGKFSFYATALRSLRDRHGLGGEVDVARGLRMPDVVRADAEDIARERAPERVVAPRDRLRENVQQLAEGVALDEQRLAQEIAILADRLDVGEELDRFRAHLGAFRHTIESPTAEAVGK